MKTMKVWLNGTQALELMEMLTETEHNGLGEEVHIVKSNEGNSVKLELDLWVGGDLTAHKLVLLDGGMWHVETHVEV